jgi:purine-binding chemotaxis protein CheW
VYGAAAYAGYKLKSREEIVERRQPANNGGDLSDQHALMIFRLADQTYALPIESVIRIIEMVTITPIPQVGSAVEGVINVRGTAVPVINLRQHFGLPRVPLGLRSPIVLVRIREQMFGLIVDQVIDVISRWADQITRVADILPEELGEAPVLQGLVHIQDDAALLLDVDHLLLPNHVQAVVQAVTTLPEAAVETAPEDAEMVPMDDSAEPPTGAEDEETSEGEGGWQAVEPAHESGQEVGL